jgi:type IV pilus assembly protein PilY1
MIMIYANGSYADDTEIFAVRADPNVLILIDNSGSMNEVVYHKNYEPLTNYPGGYVSGEIYRLHASTYQSIDVTENGKTVFLLYGPGDDNTGVRYNGNYLNWIFWHATEAERSQLFEQSNKTRIQAAKEVLVRIVHNTPGVRFGLMRFDSEHGGWLTAECGAETSVLTSAIQGMLATTWTPLSETMVEAWEYFRGSNNSFYRNVRYTSPIQYHCQRNIIILITDGEPTKDWTFPDWVLANIAGQYDTTLQSGNENQPYYLDGVAWFLNVNDASGNLVGLQNVVTYPIGFNIHPPLLERTAHRGGGLYLTASNAEQLTAALEKVILDVIDKSFSFSSPSVPAVRTVHDNIIYLTSLEPNETPFWKGDLKAYRLEPDGALRVDSGGNPDPSALIWGANEKLRTIPSADRKIMTSAGGAMKAFTTASVTNSDLDIEDDASREKLIDHIRGRDAYDMDPKDGVVRVDRRWKLGDIFHSNPAVVGAPSKFFRDPGFNGPGGFYEQNKKRTRVTIVGSNDGMLHAFNAGRWIESKGGHDEGTGVEEWAFIPGNTLKNLKRMASFHTFYVDSSPKIADIWFYSTDTDTTKSAEEWRTVLVSGLRKGGKHYFALDVTDTQNPKYLWEFPKPRDIATLDKVGQSWSEPAIGRVKIELGGELYERWVAFIGAGFDPTETKTREAIAGKGLFVIDVKSGEIVKEFSGLAGMNYSMPAAPTAVDTNLDGFVDKVYIGDLGGQIWAFDVSFDPLTKRSNSQWSGRRLFQAPATAVEKHPIHYQPAVAFDQDQIPWVYFGTGDRENPNDSTNPPERFYAVKDDGKGSYPRKEENLKDLIGLGLNTFAKVADLQKGWFLKLEKADGKHEKVLTKPAVFNHLVYFTTYSYKQTSDPCRVIGDTKVYIVEYLSGGGAFTADELTDLLEIPSERSRVIGEGIPSAPVISVNSKGKASIIIGATSGQIFSRKAFSPSTNKDLLYWREVIP